MKDHIVEIEMGEFKDYMNLKIIVRCVVTGEMHNVFVRSEDYNDWIGGELIQNCMKYLSSCDRELLISGVGPTGYATLFPKEI